MANMQIGLVVGWGTCVDYLGWFRVGYKQEQKSIITQINKLKCNRHRTLLVLLASAVEISFMLNLVEGWPVERLCVSLTHFRNQIV